tara:strand:- start:2350 stop:2748 length:399 start_codon:yes stop_codon:yes gene_type:complete
MKDKRINQKIHDEHSRVFVHTSQALDSPPVIFRNVEKASIINKQKQKEISQRPQKEKEEDGGILPLEKVSHEFKEILQKARTAKSLKQSDLAKNLNVKQSIVNDWESGKAKPTPQQRSQLIRILGIKNLPKN